MITATILRSNDGSKCKIDVTPSLTLSKLKEMIHDSSLDVQPKHQRIFFLGRELKSGSRSLESLGFGKFGVNVLHLMSSQPATVDLSRGRTSQTQQRKKSSSSNSRATAVSETVVLLDSPSPPERKRSVNTSSSSSGSGGSSNDVIDLLDDDDDDDEVVEVVAPVATKRRRRRQGNA